MGPWIWVYGTLDMGYGPWIWVWTLDMRYGTLDIPLVGPWQYPDGAWWVLPRVHPPLYPPVLHQPATRYSPLLNAYTFLSKLQLVDHRFTIMHVARVTIVSVRVQHASDNVRQLPECAYFPNRTVIYEVS